MTFASSSIVTFQKRQHDNERREVRREHICMVVKCFVIGGRKDMVIWSLYALEKMPFLQVLSMGSHIT
jgi:hypothetical protein